MANWFTNQKAKRLIGDMPLTEDMTGSGGPKHMAQQAHGKTKHHEDMGTAQLINHMKNKK